MSDDTLLRQSDVRQRMRCSGVVAANIDEAFVTVEQLLKAIESDDPLTDVSGVGPKTASVLKEWYEHREDRERQANDATFKRTSGSAATITFHEDWSDALGMDSEGQEAEA